MSQPLDLMSGMCHTIPTNTLAASGDTTGVGREVNAEQKGGDGVQFPADVAEVDR